MRRRATLPVLASCLLLLLAAPARAEPRLPAVFGDGMVLQRESPVPVWGRADPGERIIVRIAGRTKTAAADEDGRWRVTLAPMKAGGPHRLTVKGSSGRSVTIANVLVGEVWICSGQSNMAWPVRSVENAKAEIAAARYPGIRLLAVPRRAAGSPREDLSGSSWVACSPETVARHSAVSYFFGREIHRRLGIPVGLVDTSFGGTPAEAWTRREALDGVESLAPLLARWDARVSAFDPEKAKADHEKRLEAWRKAVERARKAGKRPPRKPRYSDPRASPQRPAGLWNAMVAPLVPFAIRGAIWYQGESNASRARQYRTLFPALIRDWRAAWGRGDFPFYFVQLANFRPVKPDPGESQWAELREAQLLALLSVPRTGMAVTIDIGEARNIHPKNKQEVGRRLALWALARDYAKKVEPSGPILASHDRRGDEIVLRFDHVGGGLVARGRGGLRGFAIAGADRRFRWAEARIEGETVVVRHPEIPEPEAVRYAWADNPVCNLANRAGLPASPFRTDDWPGITQGR